MKCEEEDEEDEEQDEEDEEMYDELDEYFKRVLLVRNLCKWKKWKWKWLPIYMQSDNG